MILQSGQFEKKRCMVTKLLKPMTALGPSTYGNVVFQDGDNFCKAFAGTPVVHKETIERSHGETLYVLKPK